MCLIFMAPQRYIPTKKFILEKNFELWYLISNQQHISVTWVLNQIPYSANIGCGKMLAKSLP